MPQPPAPNLSGFPLWLQIVLYAAFGLTTLFLAFRGYKKPEASTETKGQVLSASIADMGAIRHLSDVIALLVSKVDGTEVTIRIEASGLKSTLDSLETAIREHTHWTRNDYELQREVVGKLRRLTELLEERQRGG